MLETLGGLAPLLEESVLGAGRKGFYEHFQLKEAPFRDTVNPRFLYRSRREERAHLRLKMFLEDKGALGLVTGPSGVGKSLLLQCLLEELSASGDYLPISLFATPGMSLSSLLYEILYELEAERPGFRRQAMLEQLHERILAEAQSRRRVVLLLDEAHFLSSSALHLLRTLTNLETPDEKLVTLVLFAEEGFLRRLSHPSYQSLSSRITCHVKLTPLDREQTEQYVKFRLLAAGGGTTIFTKEAFELLHESTGGVPRRVSRLAAAAMQEAYLDDLPVVDRERIRRALARQTP